MSNLFTNKKSVARIQIISAALLWGLAGVCVKSITWGSLPLMACRSLISLIVMLTAKRSFKINFSKSNILGGIFASGTGILYIEAIKQTTAGTAIVLQYIAPILVFLFAIIFQGRKARIAEILLTLAVFGGCVLSFADNIDPSHLIGDILGIASGFTFAGQIIVMNHENSDPFDCVIIGNIISVLICSPFFFTDSSVTFDIKNIIWVGILCLFQYAIANLLFSKGIQYMDKVESSLLLTIEPIFNPILTAIVCHERMGTLAIIGAAIVILGVTAYSILPSKNKQKEDLE